MRAGLIDDLAYEDEVDDKIKLAPGKTHYIECPTTVRSAPRSLGLDRGPRIAVIYASGLIASGKTATTRPAATSSGPTRSIEYLRKARADSSVKAIVLRIDSPGGSAIASDIIWREMLLTKNRKPLIASMSDVAASGGYYIAMPAHAIVAEPSTLTGSIGVVLTKFVIDGTLKKLGHEHGRRDAGTLRRSLFAGAPVLARRARARGGERCRRPTTRSSRRRRRDATRRRKRSTPSGRAACGPGVRRSRSAWSTSWAASIAPSRSPSSAPGSPQDSDVELVIYPPKKSFYDYVRSPFGRPDGSRDAGLVLGLQQSPGRAGADRAAAGLPPRRAAGADAEHFCPLGVSILIFYFCGQELENRDLHPTSDSLVCAVPH